MILFINCYNIMNDAEKQSLNRIDSFQNSFLLRNSKDLYSYLISIIKEDSELLGFQILQVFQNEIYLIFMKDKMGFFGNNFGNQVFIKLKFIQATDLKAEVLLSMSVKENDSQKELHQRIADKIRLNQMFDLKETDFHSIQNLSQSLFMSTNFT